MNFDAVAPYYSLLESILAGRLMQRARRFSLGHIGPDDRVLLVGDGPGRFLEMLRRKHPLVRATSLDCSAAMLRRSRGRIASMPEGTGGLDWIHADAMTWPGNGESFDVVVTHFVFDCHPAEDQQRLVDRLTPMMKPGARWLVAEFQPAPRGWRRIRSQILLALLYVFFRTVVRLPARRWNDPAPSLERAGWIRESRRHMDAGWMYAECWRRS